MAGYGMIILGPTLHFWFNFVSKLFPGRDLFSTLKKMAMGQGIYGPAMTVIFFSLNAGLQGMVQFSQLNIFHNLLLYIVFLCLPFLFFPLGRFAYPFSCLCLYSKLMHASIDCNTKCQGSTKPLRRPLLFCLTVSLGCQVKTAKRLLHV